MKVTEFDEMVKRMVQIAEGYVSYEQSEALDFLEDILWDNLEYLISDDDRNYN